MENPPFKHAYQPRDFVNQFYARVTCYTETYLDLSVRDGVLAKARPIESDPVTVVFNVHRLYPTSEEPSPPFCVQAGYRGGARSSYSRTHFRVCVCWGFPVVSQNLVKPHPYFIAYTCIFGHTIHVFMVMEESAWLCTRALIPGL